MKSGSPSFLQRGAAKLSRWQFQITRRLLYPFARVPIPDRWIFIVGCYNSGTSLLARILAKHPLVGGMPDEGVYYTDSLSYPEQFGWPRMWVECLDQVRLDPDDATPERILRIKKQWSLAYPKGKPNLLEKSVVNAVRMPFLQAHFQPAFFISLVRNGYAVAEGIQRRTNPAGWKNPRYSEQYPIELCARQWRASDEVIGRDGENLERFIQISYEDLTSEPVGVMRKVTDFLGLPALDSSVLEQAWFIRDKRKTIQNMNAGSFERLSDEDVRAIERVAGDGLAKYGYSVS